MNRLAEVLDRPEPTMAVSFGAEVSGEQIDRIARVADVAELRADLLPSQGSDYLAYQAMRLEKLPVLLTVRILPEGGKWVGSMGKRKGLFNLLMPHVDGVDVELKSKIAPHVIDGAHSQGKVVIASRHNFAATPSAGELEDMLGDSQRAGADYFKIAATTNTGADYQILQNFTHEHVGDNAIVVAMDPNYENPEYGPRSRVELPGLGSRLTYASTGTEEAVAPGQMSYLVTHEKLRRTYPAYAKLFNY